jgi:hypothetical protein
VLLAKTKKVVDSVHDVMKSLVDLRELIRNTDKDSNRAEEVKKLKEYLQEDINILKAETELFIQYASQWLVFE